MPGIIYYQFLFPCILLLIQTQISIGACDRQNPAALRNMLSLLFLSLLPLSSQFTMNVPNVLLPQHISGTVLTNFTLTVDKGCFTWLSTKEHVVSIDTLYGDDPECSQSAVLASVSEVEDRQSSIILAQESGSHNELRVDVFIDVIKRIVIRTTSQELLLEETPSPFEVVAFDEEGNTFSSLDGLEFSWSIAPDVEHITDSPVLKTIRYTDSTYQTPGHIDRLERQGKQGHKVLVQGINTGVAWVKTILSHPSYKGVVEASVRVVVIENLLLNPAYDVWVLTLTQIIYRAERRQHGRKTEIAMPSEQYSLTLSNDTVALLQDSTVTTLVVGETDVILIDRNVAKLPLGTPPHTTVHVVPPESLEFKIADDNWNLQRGSTYTFTIAVLGPQKRRVLESNVRIQLEVDSTLEVLSSNEQGTQHTVKGASSGRTVIRASLTALIHPVSGEEVPVAPSVEGEQGASVWDPITLVPVLTVLPLYNKAPYTYKLRAEGGSGSYLYTSSTPTVVSIANDGTVTGRNAGRVVIKAADTKNLKHFGQAEVLVSPVTGLSFLPAKVEALLGDTLRLPLLAYVEIDGKKLPFTRCDDLPVAWSLSNELFEITSEENSVEQMAQGICRILTVRALRSGNTVIKASYDSGRLLTATITLAAYPNLLAPANVPVVTLGSSAAISLSGGPQPWVLDKAHYSQHIKAGPGVRAEQCSDNRGGGYGVSHCFRITCLQLGEQSAVVLVSNKGSAHNKFPAGEMAQVRVLCAAPHYLTFTATLPVPADPARCPALASNLQVPVLTSQQLSLEFTVSTSDHVPFDNCSSLLFTATSSAEDRLTLEPASLYSISSSGSSITAALSTLPGPVEAVLAVAGYEDGHMMDAGIEATLDTALVQSLRLRLVTPLTLSDTALTLFNYDGGSGEVEVVGGSGVFSVASSNEGIVHLSTTTQTPFKVTPVLQGVTTLSVQDACIRDLSAAAHVHVTGAVKISVSGVSKVQVGDTVTLTVTVIDSDNRQIASRVYPRLHLAHTLSSPHISLVLSEGGSGDSAEYRLIGNSIGSSAVLFTASQREGEELESVPHSVTVFAPLTLNPAHIVLLAGASFQVRHSGGPPHDSTLTFTSSNETISTVNSRGLVTGVSEGEILVLGRSVGTGPDRSAVYSQTEVTVKVVELEGVHIRAVSTILLQRARLPLTVWGMNERGPFSFASVPGITFVWSVGSNILLNSLYSKSGYSVEEEAQFTVSMLGVSAGITMVTVTASYTDSDGLQRTFSDSISVQVIKKAELMAPATPELLLSPGAVYSVRTNKDHTHSLSYTLLSGQGLITLDQDGTISADSIGSGVLQITINEDKNFNQTLLVSVEVKAMFALLVSGAVGLRVPDSAFHSVPVSQTTEFTIGTQDDLGREFDAISKTTFHCMLNRLDVVSVSGGKANNTISVTSLVVGEVILRVWNEEGLEGWAYVRVSAPEQTVEYVIGLNAVGCLTQLIDKDTKGEWRSSDTSVVLVHDAVLRGVSVGQATLTKQVTPATFSQIKVTVVSVDNVTLKPSSSLLSNHPSPLTSSSVTLPVSVTTALPLTPLTALEGAKCGDKPAPQVFLRCVSSHPVVVSTSPQFNPASGVYSCTAAVLPNTGCKIWGYWKQGSRRGRGGRRRGRRRVISVDAFK